MSEFSDFLSPKDVRFEIRFALGQMDRSTIIAWAGKDRLKREAAVELIADRVAVRFEPLQVARKTADLGPLFRPMIKP